MRKDVAELNEGAADRLTKHGMIINTVSEIGLFRQKLTDAGFYTTWQRPTARRPGLAGEDGWTLDGSAMTTRGYDLGGG